MRKRRFIDSAGSYLTKERTEACLSRQQALDLCSCAETLGDIATNIPITKGFLDNRVIDPNDFNE